MSRKTFAIIAGASDWPRLRQFEPAGAFLNSAMALRGYLLGEQGLNLSKDSVLWLFDKPNAVDQLDQIDQFVGERLHSIDSVKGEDATLIFGYVGHGALFGAARDYCLLVRDTRAPIEGDTSLRLGSLASVLRARAPESARMLLLDCCFAGEAARKYQGAVDQVVSAKTHEVVEQASRDRGVAILCASSARNPAELESLTSSTLFGQALKHVLEVGDPYTLGRLSLRRICSLIEERLASTQGEDHPRPEVHVPDQTGGDLAAVPFFPNPATPHENATPSTPLLTIRVSSKGAPVAWRDRIRLNVKTGGKKVIGVAPDIDGLVNINDASAGPLVIHVRRQIDGQHKWLLAPLRAIESIPATVEINLDLFSAASWVDYVPVADDAVIELSVGAPSISANPLRRHHAPWGLPYASIVIDREAYILGYEPDWGIPRWVANRVTPIGGGTRPDQFPFDATLPEKDRVRTSDYIGTGFDRGALISSYDVRSLGQDAMNSTNLMSVIAPQHPEVNRGTWLDIEEFTRQQASEGSGVVVISGPVFAANHGEFTATRFGDRRIVVPDGFFRILARHSAESSEADPNPLVFLIPNEPVPHFALDDYVTTLSQVESLTGLTFFGDCHVDVRSALTSSGQSELWPPIPISLADRRDVMTVSTSKSRGAASPLEAPVVPNVVAQTMKELDLAVTGALPRKGEKGNRLVASWRWPRVNRVTNEWFAAVSDGTAWERDLRAVHLTALVMRHFDAIAIQGILPATDYFDSVVAILGDDWGYLITEPLGRTSWRERFAVVFDKRRFVVQADDGALILPDGRLEVLLAEQADGRHFYYPPFCARLTATGFELTLVNVHIAYSTLPERIEEIEWLGRWVAGTLVEHGAEDALIAGQLQLGSATSPEYRAFEAAGLRLGPGLEHAATRMNSRGELSSMSCAIARAAGTDKRGQISRPSVEWLGGGVLNYLEHSRFSEWLDVASDYSSAHLPVWVELINPIDQS